MLRDELVPSGERIEVQDLTAKERQIVFERASTDPRYLRKLTSGVLRQANWQLLREPVRVHTLGYEKLNVSASVVNPAGEEAHLMMHVYSSSFSEKRRSSVVSAMMRLEAEGIPIPHYRFRKEMVRAEPQRPSGPVLAAVVTDFCPGTDFTQRAPADGDIKEVFAILGRIHKINFPAGWVYDSWSPINLVAEAEKRLDKLDDETKKLVGPTVEKMKGFDQKSLTLGLIHGDLHRAHVLKEGEGKYCLIDWDLVTTAPLAIDIGTALAHWCSTDRLTDLAFNSYREANSLSDKDANAALDLRNALFATFVMRARAEQILNGDTSTQTQNWYEFGKRGLETIAA